MIVKRIIAFLLGLVLLAAVIWLGLQATSSQVYVVWFGLASAILAPTGVALIGYTLTGGQRETLQRLSKVPEIDKLISEAKTQEERIRLLEEERSRLLEAVRIETRRQTLITKKAALEEDGARILGELQAVERELNNLELDIEASTVKEEIKNLNERLEAHRRGDPVFRLGETYVRLNRDLIRGFPLSTLLLIPGFFAEAMFTFVEISSVGILRFAETISGNLARWVARLTNLLDKIIDKFRRG